MLQYREDKNALRKYIFDNEEFFSNISLDAAMATGTMLRSDIWFDRAISKYRDEKKEACNMCKAIDDMMMDSKMEGKIEGKMEGEIIGRVLTYYELGFSTEEISAKMNLPVDKIQCVLDDSAV